MSPGRRNVRTAAFDAMYERLPPEIHGLAEAAFRAFVANPNHPALRRHRLKDTDRGQHRRGSISVSVNRQYRGIYFEDGKRTSGTGSVVTPTTTRLPAADRNPRWSAVQACRWRRVEGIAASHSHALARVCCDIGTQAARMLAGRPWTQQRHRPRSPLG